MIYRFRFRLEPLKKRFNFNRKVRLKKRKSGAYSRSFCNIGVINIVKQQNIQENFFNMEKVLKCFGTRGDLKISPKVYRKYKYLFDKHDFKF